MLKERTTTENGMATNASSLNKVLDLFYKIGASRGTDILPDFVAAYVQNPELALRVALWARDARHGAGERQVFLDIITYLANVAPEHAALLLAQAPAVGRWKDVLVGINTPVEETALELISVGLSENNALCAKWMPRKGPLAAKIRSFLKLSPKGYRKLLVSLTDVVETSMCKNEWDTIDYSKVPSLAIARYKSAFSRHSPQAFNKYVTSLVRGETKVNAAAIFPHDVLKSAMDSWQYGDDIEQREFIIQQWKALPSYSANVMPLVDVSGSMAVPVGSASALTIAVGLGLYFSERATGPYKDCFLTFSEQPKLMQLQGDVIQRMEQMSSADWGFNTNLVAALDKLVSVALQNSCDLPETLLILSDMQFDQAVEVDDAAYEALMRRCFDNGLRVPKVVFWNLVNKRGVPVEFDAHGVALVSGYNPHIMEAICNAKEFTPESVMMEALSRYEV